VFISADEIITPVVLLLQAVDQIQLPQLGLRDSHHTVLAEYGAFKTTGNSGEKTRSNHDIVISV
jgi:hypothetical protein